MSQELTVTAIVAFVGFAFAALLIRFARRHSAAVRVVLTPLLTSAGWTNLQPVFFADSGLKGTWRSFPVQLAYRGRQKSVPERLILKVVARSDARLIIKRRTHTLLNRPFTLFGPPLIDLRHTGAEQFWIRSDETALAERLFSDDRLVALISSNLVAAFDEIRVDPKGLRIMRSLDDRPVRGKYNIAFRRMRFEPARFEPIAREELALSQALVETLMAV